MVFSGIPMEICNLISSHQRKIYDDVENLMRKHAHSTQSLQLPEELKYMRQGRPI
jgi:hypothetical protein